MNRQFGILYILTSLFWGGFPGGVSGSGLMEGENVTLPAETIFLGPWGELRSRRVVIEPPEPLLDLALWEQPSSRWRFAGRDAEALRALLAEVGMREDNVHRLVAGGVEDEGGITVFPADGLMVRLPTSVRIRIYRELARDGENRLVQDPLWIPSEDLSYWLDDRVLAPEAAGCLQDILYPHNGFWLLSDVDVLLRCVGDDEARRRLLRLVLRQASTEAALRVPAGASVEEQVQYWRRPRGMVEQNAALRARLEAAAREGGLIPVRELLPPAMAERLDRFQPEEADVFRDCHWTAMNFFNDPPDDRYLRAEAIRASLTSDYFRVEGQAPSFGDLVLFRDERQEVVHACIYVAGNLVFTKNGGADERPWVLMPLEEVRSLYSLHRPVEVFLFRRLDRGADGRD